MNTLRKTFRHSPFVPFVSIMYPTNFFETKSILLKGKHMQILKSYSRILTALGLTALFLAVMFIGCTKNDTSPVSPPVVTPPQTTVQPTVNLRSTSGFVVLAGSLISNVPTSALTGNVGLSPAARAAITGFGLTEVTGTIYASDDISPAGVPAMLTTAKGDLTTAYNDAAGRTVGAITVAGNLGGRTLAPGLYKSTSTLEISSGDLTLDAQGNANAVWIFQIASTLTTTSGRQVILSGGAKASNIFWQVGSSAT